MDEKKICYGIVAVILFIEGIANPILEAMSAFVSAMSSIVVDLCSNVSIYGVPLGIAFLAVIWLMCAKYDVGFKITDWIGKLFE